MAVERLSVAALSMTPVKGLRIARRERVQIDRAGLRGDRRLFIVDDRARMVNGKHHGELNEIAAELDEDERLTLSLPDGQQLSGPLVLGEELEIAFRTKARRARLLNGPFSAALSEHVGVPLRLVEPSDGSSALDRGPAGAVTLISGASLAELSALAGADLDARRFRMSIELAGAEPFEEEQWLGRELRVGEAILRPLGHVGRCLVTSRDPDTGVVDVPTLDLLRELRGDAATTEPLALGVHAAVLVPGAAAIGDAVEMLDTARHADRPGRR